MMMKMVWRFVAMAAAYLAFAGQISTDECVAAGISAAALMCLSLIAHRSHGIQFRFDPASTLRQAAAALPKLLTDTLALIPRLLRPGSRTGTMSQEFVANAGSNEDAAWWAVFTLSTSLPPNSFLITRLARPREVIIHRLAEPRQ